MIKDNYPVGKFYCTCSNKCSCFQLLKMSFNFILVYGLLPAVWESNSTGWTILLLSVRRAVVVVGSRALRELQQFLYQKPPYTDGGHTWASSEPRLTLTVKIWRWQMLGGPDVALMSYVRFEIRYQNSYIALFHSWEKMNLVVKWGILQCSILFIKNKPKKSKLCGKISNLTKIMTFILRCWLF